MYRVILTEAAKRDLKSIPKKAYFQIAAKLRLLQNDSRPSGCRKIAGSDNDWRIRMGHYRIIYEINNDIKTISVYRIKHRKDAYRNIN